MKQVLEGITNFLTKFLEGIKISQNSYFENSILKFPRLCACKSLIYLNLYKRTFLIKVNGCWLEDLYFRKFLLTKYFKFWVRRLYKSNQTLQIYYRISQEQSSSTVTFQVLIWNEIVESKWSLKVKVLSLTTPRGAIMGKIWLSWIFRLLENAFATNADLKMLSDTNGDTHPQPQSPCTFMQISLYIILLTRNSCLSKSAFP